MASWPQRQSQEDRTTLSQRLGRPCPPSKSIQNLPLSRFTCPQALRAWPCAQLSAGLCGSPPPDHTALGTGGDKGRQRGNPSCSELNCEGLRFLLEEPVWGWGGGQDGGDSVRSGP